MSNSSVLQFSVSFLMFFELCDRRFRLPLSKACELASIEYQSALNQRHHGVFEIKCVEPEVKSNKKKSRLIFVMIDDLYAYLYPGVPIATAVAPQPTVAASPAGRRGKPTRFEQEEAQRLGITVPQLRLALSRAGCNHG